MASAEVCVIFNPSAGRKRAGRRLQRLRRTLGLRADFHATQGPGHAEELAFTAAQAGYPVVAAAGGDGTVHEVANGLMRAGRPEVRLAIFPIGSANDYANALDLDADGWTSDVAGPAVRAVDAGVARAGDGRQRYFLNGLGLGLNGAVTLESRRIRGLQGVPLYTVALLRALWRRYTYLPMTLTIDETTRRLPTLALTVALGRREGNFVLAPDARVDDGLFDFLHAGALSRWELLRYIPGMITGRLPENHPALWRGRCRHVQLQAQGAITVHLDGEMFCVPEQDVRALDVQILPGALHVQTRPPWGRGRG